MAAAAKSKMMTLVIAILVIALIVVLYRTMNTPTSEGFQFKPSEKDLQNAKRKRLMGLAAPPGFKGFPQDPSKTMPFKQAFENALKKSGIKDANSTAYKQLKSDLFGTFYYGKN